MIKEIGSEFWYADTQETEDFNFGDFWQFFLSGRTALEFIIRDILAIKRVRKVYLPSYCCHTMIAPFVDLGIDVIFYEVKFDSGRVTRNFDPNVDCEVILLMQYFGFYDDDFYIKICNFKMADKIVIEDSTHSFFMKGNDFSCRSDYVFASLRKWTGLPAGAVAFKKGFVYNISLPQKYNNVYANKRIEAMSQKREYLDSGSGLKADFLSLFQKAESELENDYKDYGLQDEYIGKIKMLDGDKIRKNRRENASHLYEALKEMNFVNTLSMGKTDVPLFQPIFVDKELRNPLHNFMVSNGIYCPKHWPITELHRNVDTDLFNKEISLICDQRYSIKDMNRIIRVIRRFFGEDEPIG